MKDKKENLIEYRVIVKCHSASWELWVAIQRICKLWVFEQGVWELRAGLVD